MFNTKRKLESGTDLDHASVVDALLNDQSHHIEFNGHLTNHK